MNFDPDRVQQIMRYAVAAAASADDFRHRELGPIHLLKYAYLADLAYAEKHGGATYTGLPWRFHHFGPWANEAREEIEHAMALPAIQHRVFQSPDQEDGSRWSTRDAGLEECLEGELPREVARAVRSAVRDFANDTPGLLHHVYRTPPMLRAAPGEDLDFSAAIPLPLPREPSPLREDAEPSPCTSLSKTARKRRKEAHDALRRRAQEALAKSRRDRPDPAAWRPPRYDEVFVEGQKWLDSLAGEPITPLEGELIVSKEIWKSPTRSEPLP